jgi:small multidrug resistance pump
MQNMILLFGAIVSEVIATTALKLSAGFSKLIPSLIVVMGYGASFYLLSLSLRTLSIGVTYAIWSGVGIVLTVAVGIVLWREALDLALIVGLLLIITGVLAVNLSSSNSVH